MISCQNTYIKCIVVYGTLFITLLFESCTKNKRYYEVDMEISTPKMSRIDSLKLNLGIDTETLLRWAIKEYTLSYGDIDSVFIDGKLKFLTEGDLILSDSGLIEHLNMYDHLQNFSYIDKEYITVRVHRGRRLLLDEPKEVTYAIERASFPENAIYTRVKLSIAAAADQWNSVCGVQFKYKPDWDLRLTPKQHPDGLFFVVRYANVQGDFVASSFYPHYKKIDRVIVVNHHYATAKYDSVGIFRHELGHAMGFLHEHLRAGSVARCPDESSVPHFNIGMYDPKSVMHYYCKTVGFGTYSLNITDIDAAGAIELYPK